MVLAGCVFGEGGLLMNEAKIALLVCLAVLIFVPVARKILADIDYKRQLKGRRPERTCRDDAMAFSSSETEQQKETKEMLAVEARTRGMQNFIGPK